MEENKTPNKSEKEIIKENMLILYKAYQDGEKNTVDEISYYKQIVLQSEKSPRCVSCKNKRARKILWK